MKLALVTQHYAPHFEGGTESVVRAQARELVRLGCSVRVISGTDRAHAGVDVERAVVDGIEVSFLPRTPDEFYDLLLARPRVRGRVRELVDDCDVVHLHHWSTLDRELVRSLAPERPVVVTLHDLFVTCPRFFRIPVAPIERCPEPGDFEPCSRCAAADVPTIPLPSLHEGFRQRDAHFRGELDAARLVVAPSRAHLERHRRFVPIPEERAAVVAHGLCLPLERDADAAPAWDGSEPLRVLFLGHRSDVKGTLELAIALRALGPDAARVELLLLGDVVQDGFDERLRAAAGPLALRFLGPYDLEQLPARLVAAGGAHLAATPSLAYESYGLVVDEALALGLPVWTSDRGAPPERIGAAGRVLPADDPSAWTRAFAELLERPARLADQRRAVPDHVRTAADAAADLLRLYEPLLTPAP